MGDRVFYRYIFRFADGSQKDFKVILEGDSLSLVTDSGKSFPEWTRLENKQCVCCPLDANETEYCPIARELAEVIEFFRRSVSFEEVDVIIESEQRTYSQHTALQIGLSSLIGIYMVTCGCPVMEKLKPMVRFHLPFASLEETNYRVLSMYLLAQYFIGREGGSPDWKLEGLIETYRNIREVNMGFCQRLRSIGVQDASINALIGLDMCADSVPFSINENMIGELKRLFDSYLT